MSELADTPIARVSTGLEHVDELLRGGAVLGSTWELSGMPGAGKSTLAMRIAAEVASRAGRDALYVSAEMPEKLVRHIAERCEAPGDPLVWATPFLEDVERYARDTKPAAIVLDSRDRLEVDGERGSESSILAVMLSAVALATACQALVICIAHATKDGEARGALSSAHDGDAVIWLDHEAITVRKHRYGPAGACPAPTFGS